MEIKEKLQKRGALVKSAKDLIDKIELENRAITNVEQTKFDSILAEVDKITEEVRAEGRTLTKYNGSNFSEIVYELGQSFNKPIKNNPEGQSYNDPNEIRIFNKSNLNEMRSFIDSRDKSGITEPVSAGKFIKSLATGNWAGAETERRLLGTATEGGNYLVPELISSQIIEMALNKTQVMTAGASTVPMESKVLIIPRITKMPETEWKGENLAFSKSMIMNFEGVTLTAKTIMALISLSVELAEDGINVESTIENALAQSIALAVDKACLTGGGGLQPVGITQTLGVLSTPIPAPLTDYAPFSRAFTKIENNNGTPTALIMASSLFGELDLLTSAVELQPLLPPQSWSKYKQLSSNQLVCQGILGDFRQLLIGTRTQINIEVTRSTETAFKNMQVWVRAYLRMDCALKNIKHFCILDVGASASVSPSESVSPSGSLSPSASASPSGA